MADSLLDTKDEWTRDTVIFRVCPRYDPDQAIVCEYKVHPQYIVQSRDYVALYAVEEFQPSTTLSNYMTWQWADIRISSEHRTINFPGRHLPQSSLQFLLFAYISRSNGVIGSSDAFQITHFCGDPVSFISCTTGKSSSSLSSFVILERSPSACTTTSLTRKSNSVVVGDHQSFVTNTTQNETENADDNNAMQEGKGAQMEEITAVCQGERGDSSTAKPIKIIDKEFKNNVREAIDYPEMISTVDATSTVSSKSTTQGTQKIYNEMEGKMHTEQCLPEGVHEDTKSLQSEIEREKEKSLEMLMVIDETKKENEKRINWLEGEMGKQAVENAMLQKTQDKQRDLTALHDQITKLTQENQDLCNEITSVQSQLEAREHDLSYTKEKLSAANTRIRDLEHALITERLNYESNLKKPSTADSAVNTNSNEAVAKIDPEDTTLQGKCDQSSNHEGLSSFIPTQQRSASALVRLGIEDEAVATLDRQEFVQEQSTDIRCPICNKPALLFRDQAAFHVHVNGHFEN